jgi:hypothetical protein
MNARMNWQDNVVVNVPSCNHIYTYRIIVVIIVLIIYKDWLDSELWAN